jgi:quercetin dioxygenase-like cupin family protein
MTEDRGGDPACWSHLFDDAELAARGVVDLNAVPAPEGSGVLWSAPPGDLNVNLVSLQPGDTIEEHRNDDLDVLIVVLSGDGEITIDDEVHPVTGQQLVLLRAGVRRSFRAGQWRLVYLSIHRARGPAQIRPPRHLPV